LKVCPCRACMAEAIVEATVDGYKVICTVCPAEHQTGPYRSRDKTIREWNKKQEGAGHAKGNS